ncbi:MAG: response regulator [Planctomycetota bacterium]|nr:response regulator [Planctomycetota bacterium]
MVDLLVVDNDARIADLVAWFLERGGHTPRVVTSYSAAREALRESTFTLMLADLELGAEDGRVELPLLESEGILPPTLVVSGYLDAEITMELLEIPHVLGTVPKPFEPSELLARVDQAIEAVHELVVEASPETPSLIVETALDETSAPAESEPEVLREVLIDPQAAPTKESGSSDPVDDPVADAVDDEDGWIEISSEGFSDHPKWDGAG